jgi:hypothetical protein
LPDGDDASVTGEQIPILGQRDQRQHEEQIFQYAAAHQERRREQRDE